MRLSILVLVLAAMTVLADKPMKPYVSPGQVKKQPPAPPLPFAPNTKIKAMSAPVVAPSSTPTDPLSPNYATVTKFKAQYEGGKTGIALSIKWPNWPATNAYSINRTTNFSNWFMTVISSGDEAPELRIYDLEAFEFYKLNKAWVGSGTSPTPAP